MSDNSKTGANSTINNGIHRIVSNPILNPNLHHDGVAVKPQDGNTSSNSDTGANGENNQQSEINVKAGGNSSDFPGFYENLHAEIKNITPLYQLIDGAKVVIAKPLSNNFQCTHTVLMGGENSYKFGVTYCHGDPKKPESVSPILQSDIDNNGQSMSNIIYNVTEYLKAKFIYQRRRQADAAVFQVDYSGSDHSLSARVINPNIITSSFQTSANYLQKITDRFSIGGELFYEYRRPYEEAGFSIGGKYVTPGGSIASGVISPMAGSVNFSLLHAINSKISLWSEFETNLATMSSSVNAGYKCDFRQNSVSGMIDSGCVVSGIFESKLAPGFSFVLTASLDHLKDKNTFGVGILLGQ